MPEFLGVVQKGFSDDKKLLLRFERWLNIVK